jgi:pilus (MSHA type) biogenesis protein MshL
MKKTWITYLPILMIWALLACSHQSTVAPSAGHIDGRAPGSQHTSVQAESDIPKPISNFTYLPPPVQKVEEPTYSVVVNEAPVKEILFALARESKLNMDIHPAIQGRVTLNAVDQTLTAILARLSRQVDLAYRYENNVLSVTPDYPELRTYTVDYINMSRDTKGFIGAAAEISGTGQGADNNGVNANSEHNSSRTLVSSDSRNHFWENLERNIREILTETDKEVMISREASAAEPTSASAADENTRADTRANTATAKQEKDRARAEYKTLFASTVISNREAGIISVRATGRQHEKVEEFIAKVMNSARRQVLIEATIVEVMLSDTFQAGIDWGRIGNAGASSGFQFSQSLGSSASMDAATGRITGSGTNVFGASSSAGFIAGYINPVSALGNLFGAISLLRQFGETKVLSSPKLMVLNNQTAVLKVVDNLVYFTISAATTQSQTSSLTRYSSTPHTVPVGVVMSVTPHVDENRTVMLNVRPTVSRIVDAIQDPNPGLIMTDETGHNSGVVESKIPVIQTREMESILRVQSGDTTVLGGLMQDEIQKKTDKVPGLSDLPWAGKAFSGKNDGNRKSELVIFLRPTVISSASLDSEALSVYRQFLPSQLLQQDAHEQPN